MTQELQRAIDCISEYINPDYTLVKCFKKGVVFHHGSVPDTIRQFVEYQYSAKNEIKYILTTSTLLEGVNLPAEKIFILDNRKGRKNLTDSSLKNLIGRICRFSDIFTPDIKDLSKLEPEIYFVVGKYYRKGININDYVSRNLKVNHDVFDDCQNILLESVEINKDNQKRLNEAEEYVENAEKGTIENYSGRVVNTEIGKSCIKNNINEFDIFDNENGLQSLAESYRKSGVCINNPRDLLYYINSFFLSHIVMQNYDKLARISNDAARKYYEVFIQQKIDSDSYSQMIERTISFWKGLINNNKDTIVYVGQRWGELCRLGPEKLWIDVSKKNHSELVNLAVVRVKEEQDFIDNDLMKFAEVLNDMELVSPEFYLKLKYGVSDEKQIVLIRNGLSLTLSCLLMTKYQDYIAVDVENNTFDIDDTVIQKMRENNENEVLVFETEGNLRIMQSESGN